MYSPAPLVAEKRTTPWQPSVSEPNRTCAGDAGKGTGERRQGLLALPRENHDPMADLLHPPRLLPNPLHPPTP